MQNYIYRKEPAMDKKERMAQLKEWMRQNPEKHIPNDEMDELIYVYSDEVNELVSAMIEFYDTAGQSTYGAYMVVGLNEDEAVQLCRDVEDTFHIDLLEEY